jgi:hypothetical protein
LQFHTLKLPGPNAAWPTPRCVQQVEIVAFCVAISRLDQSAEPVGYFLAPRQCDKVAR